MRLDHQAGPQPAGTTPRASASRRHTGLSAVFPTISSTSYRGHRRCPEQTCLVGRTPEPPTPSAVTPHRTLARPSAGSGCSLTWFSPNSARPGLAQQTSVERPLSVQCSVLLRVEAPSDPRGAPTPNKGSGNTRVT